jgi:hypothetical protein
MSANNEDYSSLEATPEVQPQLHPALLRLSATISQYFIFAQECFAFSVRAVIVERAIPSTTRIESCDAFFNKRTTIEIGTTSSLAILCFVGRLPEIPL